MSVKETLMSIKPYLKSSIKKQVFFIYSLFFLISFVSIVSYNKTQLHLITNKYHAPFFDQFFKYATYLGDGILFGALVLFFLKKRKKMSLVFLVCGLLTLLITHLFKKIIFKGLPRPVKVLGEDALHLVDGVKIAMMNTFPSGHTTTAFAIATVLCFYFAKNKTQYLWIVLAIIAGYSRVYLSQHFLIDVLVGSVLGIFVGFMSVFFVYGFKKIN